MITNNILDYQGNVLGTIEFPDDTSQTVIDEALAIYATTPAVISESQTIQQAIQAAIIFGQQIMVQYSAQNVAAGITQAGQTEAVASYLSQMITYLNTGSLYAAITQINVYIADTSSTKQGLSPFVTNDILYTYLNLIQAYLQIALTPNPG